MSKSITIRRRTMLLLLICMGLAASVPSAAAPPPLPVADAGEVGLPADALKGCTETLAAAVKKGEIAGAVELIARHGRIASFEAIGMADRDAAKPMTKDAIFRLYSMSKPLVAAAAMVLYDEGKLSLDEPIARRLPEWENVQVAEEFTDATTGEKATRLVPAKGPITPRRLMSHSSGLGYSVPASPAANALRRAKTLSEYSKALASVPLSFQPGTAFQYGASIDLLGRYIEVVSGQPLDVALSDRLLKPLRMVDTAFYVPAEKKDRIATLYRRADDGLLRPVQLQETLVQKPTLMLGGQGLVSTAADYARFCQMLLNRGELDGARVLKRETVDLIFQNQLAGAYPDKSMQYGMGGQVDGRGFYWWGGAASTQFWIDTESNLFGVYMVQVQPQETALYNAFRRPLYESLGKPAPPGP